MSTQVGALESLLGGAGAAEFLRAHWPARPFAVHRTLEELPAVLRPPMMLDPTQLTRVYRGPVEVTSGRYGQYSLTGVDPSVYFDALGLAASFRDLENYLPGVQPWLRDLERDLGVPEGTATLFSFINAEGMGLGAHCDRNEHIAIQLSGTKTFRFKDNPHARYTSVSHSANREPGRNTLAQHPDGLPVWHKLPDDAESVTLSPGSVLFLPRGVYHETQGGAGGRSVTLIIHVATPSQAQVLLRYLSDYLVQSEAWRAPVVGGWSSDPAQRNAAVARLESLVGELFSGKHPLSVEHMLRHAHGGTAALAFEWGAWLQRNPSVEVQLQNDGEKLAVSVGGKQVRRIAAHAHPVLEWMLQRPGRFDMPTLARAFPEWDEDSLRTLCRFLVTNHALLVFPVQPYVPGSASSED